MGNEARENARKRGLSPGRPTATEAEQIEERLLAAGSLNTLLKKTTHNL